MTLLEFAGFETAIIPGAVWKAGGPNSAVDSKTTRVKVTSCCLTAGDPYEIEGAMASVDALAKATAVVQDVARVVLQLTPPVSADLLVERRPARMSCLMPQYVPVLLAVGDSAERRLGLQSGYGESSLPEDVGPMRRAVRALRAEGWTGAIQLPGPAPGIYNIVIPRRFARDGSLKIEWTGRLESSIPRPLIEYALGRRQGFPVGLEVVNLSMAQDPSGGHTRSWRPPSPLQLVEEAT